jgi:cytochrome P450
VRKIFTPAFSERSLTQQEPLLNKYADKLVQVLKEGIEQSSNGTKALDMSRFYTFATFDIMADLSFGESLHMLDRNEYDPWVSTVFGAIKAGIRINILNVHYPLAAKLINPILSAFFSKMRYQLHETNVARVTKRLTKGRDEEGVDLWSLILEQQEKGKEGLSREQMDSNATTFMAAGTETTATLLSGLTYLLLTHTGTMEKLVEEIRGTFKEEREITMENIAKLPYLKASINEAFRLYPPVPTGTPHLTPRDGSTICGNFIPPGVSQLLISIVREWLTRR